MFEPSQRVTDGAITELYNQLLDDGLSIQAVKDIFETWVSERDILLFITYTNNLGEKAVEVCIKNYNISTNLHGIDYSNMKLESFMYGNNVQTTTQTIRDVVISCIENFSPSGRLYRGIVHWTSKFLYIIISFMLHLSLPVDNNTVQITLQDDSTKKGSDAMLLLYEIVNYRPGMYQDIGFIPVEEPNIDYKAINRILDSPFTPDMIPDMDSDRDSKMDSDMD